MPWNRTVVSSSSDHSHRSLRFITDRAEMVRDLLNNAAQYLVDTGNNRVLPVMTKKMLESKRGITSPVPVNLR